MFKARKYKRSVAALIEKCAGTLDPERVRSMHELVEAGEWGLALETLSENLYEFSVPLTAESAAEFETLGIEFGLNEDVWTTLRELIIADV